MHEEGAGEILHTTILDKPVNISSSAPNSASKQIGNIYQTNLCRNIVAFARSIHPIFSKHHNY